MPNPWFYYLAAQLQHLIGTIGMGNGLDGTKCSSFMAVMSHTTQRGSIVLALEAQDFGILHERYPTYNLIQKVWNKTKYIQNVTGYTEFSPIQCNDTCMELVKYRLQ